MCILFWTVDNHPKYRFIFAGNRDEFLQRQTAKAHYWPPPHENVLAGTDLEVDKDSHHKKNGAWLGITKEGRFTALTNYREPRYEGVVSRGALVRDVLLDSESVHSSMQHVKEKAQSYGGFNLVSLDFGKEKETEMVYYTNREDQPIQNLEPKVIYGLSNSILNNPWPKVNEGRHAFEEILKQNNGKDEHALIESLFGLLSTTKPMSNPDDVNQILGDLKERVFIPKLDFPISSIQDPTYATRTSTVVLIDYEGNVTFVERDWFDKDYELIKEGSHTDIEEHFKLMHNPIKNKM